MAPSDICSFSSFGTFLLMSYLLFRSSLPVSDSYTTEQSPPQIFAQLEGYFPMSILYHQKNSAFVTGNDAKMTFSKFFSNEGHKRAAIKGCLGHSKGYAKSPVTDQYRQPTKMLTPPATMSLKTASLEAAIKDSLSLSSKMSDDELTQYKPFCPPKSALDELQFTSVSPTKRLTGKFRRNKGIRGPSANENSIDSTRITSDSENINIDGVVAKNEFYRVDEDSDRWLKRKLSSAGSKVTDKLRRKTSPTSNGTNLLHKTKNENDEDEEASFAFNIKPSSAQCRESCSQYDKKFNEFEKLSYYERVDGDQIDEGYEPLQTAEQCLSSLGLGNERPSEKIETDRPSSDAVSEVRLNKPIIEQTSYAIDENDIDDVCLSDQIENDTQSSTSFISENKGQGHQESMNHSRKNNSEKEGPPAIEEKVRRHDDSLVVTRSRQRTKALSKDDVVLNGNDKKIVVRKPTESTNDTAILCTKPLCASKPSPEKQLLHNFRVIDGHAKNGDGGNLSSPGAKLNDADVKEIIKRRAPTRYKLLLDEFAKNIINSNRTIIDYCKLASVFINENPNYFDEYKEFASLKDDPYNIYGPSFMTKLQKMFALDLDEAARVAGVEEDSCLVEIQEFNADDPPCKTARSNSGNVANATTVVNKLNEQGDNDFNRELLDAREAHSSSSCYSNTTLASSEIYDCGPVPFPDTSTKTLVNGLLEILGAPEEVKDTNDLKCSLLSLHPYLSRAIGFLWNVSKIAMSETDICKEKFHELQDERLMLEARMELLDLQLSSQQDFHEKRVKKLQENVDNLRKELSYMQAWKDRKLQMVDFEMHETHKKLRECLEVVEKSSEEERSKSMDLLLHRIESFSEPTMILKQHLAGALEEIDTLERRCLNMQAMKEEYVAMEKETNLLRIRDKTYKGLESKLCDLRRRYRILNAEHEDVRNQLKVKDAQLSSLKRQHEEKLIEMSGFTKEKRQRTLGFWDRAQYEAALLERDDTIDQLNYDLSIKNETISNKECQLHNINIRMEETELENHKVRAQNQLLRLDLDECKASHRIEVEGLKRNYESQISDLSSTLLQRTKYFDRELLIHKTNCQESVDQALKVALKSEISLSIISNSKRHTASKALSYLMNKKRNLTRCLETLRLESIPMNEKYFTWETIPKFKPSMDNSQKISESNDLVSIRNPSHFILIPGSVRNEEESCLETSLNDAVASGTTEEIKNQVPDLVADDDDHDNDEDALSRRISRGLEHRDNVSGADSYPIFGKRMRSLTDAVDDQLPAINPTKHQHVRSFSESLFTDGMTMAMNTCDPYHMPEVEAVSNKEKSAPDTETPVIHPLLQEPIGSYGKSSGAKFIRDKLRSNTTLYETKFYSAPRSNEFKLDTPENSKPVLSQMGNNISDFFNTVASTFSRKSDDAKQYSSEEECERDGYRGEQSPNQLRSSELRPSTSLTMTTSPITPSSAKAASGWFDFSEKNNSWYAFKFATSASKEQPRECP